MKAIDDIANIANNDVKNSDIWKVLMIYFFYL